MLSACLNQLAVCVAAITPGFHAASAQQTYWMATGIKDSFIHAGMNGGCLQSLHG